MNKIAPQKPAKSMPMKASIATIIFVYEQLKGDVPSLNSAAVFGRIWPYPTVENVAQLREKASMKLELALSGPTTQSGKIR